MNSKEQFREIDAWRGALGLLPIPLRDTDTDQRFALLNGSVGNFCLDFVGETSRDSRASAAWSSDVGHYVTFDGNRVLVTRWDRPSAEETYSARSVLDKIHDFHRHLEKETPNRGSSVVAHVLRVFRQIRAVISDDEDGRHSMQVLLHLLAATATDSARLTDHLEEWGLDADTLTVSSNSVSEARWSSFQRDLCGKGQFDILKPDVSLILRHAAGAVFEEAHRAATLSSSLWLPGLERPVTLADRKHNSMSGVYFTPAALARTLAEEAVTAIGSLDRSVITLFDPACGSGELLREMFRLLRLKGYRGQLKLIGWDISKTACQMARFVLRWEQRSWSSLDADIRTVEVDSLEATDWPVADVIIMNPPFLGWTKMSPRQKELVNSILGDMDINRPNLAMLFSARAINATATDGVLACIAPNSFLESQSARALRSALAEQFTPQLIGRLGSQNIFSNALVDAGIYIGKKQDDPKHQALVLWSDTQPSSLSHALRGLRKLHGITSETTTSDDFSIYRRPDIGRSGARWIARNYTAWQFYTKMSESRKTTPIKRVFEVNQGVRMGDDVFIVPRDYYVALGHKERSYFRPAVMNTSLVDGELNDSYYIFYPETAGLKTIDTEEELEAAVPTYYRERLCPRRQILMNRKSLDDKERWWSLSRYRNGFKEKKPRIISKYFGREKPFAYDGSGNFVVVVGHGWNITKEVMREGNLTAEEVYIATLAFANSSVFTSLVSYSSVQVAGGQFDLSNKYVNAIPIPSPSKMDSELYARLVDIGQGISIGDADSWGRLDEIVTKVVLSV